MSRLSHLLASCKSMTSMLYNYLDYPGLIGMQVKNIWQNFISCELRWVLRLFLWTRLGLHGGSARPGRSRGSEARQLVASRKRYNRKKPAG